MTETKQFATKRQRVAESPRLPIDLLAETLTFLSVLEIGPKIPSIQGASEGVDFSEAFKRATKRATQLKFDEEWNHHLEHEADGAFLAAHMSHKYRPDNVKEIIIHNCPNALRVKFMRFIVGIFSAVTTVRIKEGKMSNTAIAAVRELLQLPRLRHFVMYRRVNQLDAPLDFLGAIKSTHLETIRTHEPASALLLIPASILRGIKTIDIAFIDIDHLSQLLRKLGALNALSLIPSKHLPRGDVPRIFDLVAKHCKALVEFELMPTREIELKASELQPLFELRLKWFFLGDQCSLVGDWKSWWTTAGTAWPALETVITDIPMSLDFLADTMDSWPLLKTVSTQDMQPLRGDLTGQWSRKHPLCRLAHANFAWDLGRDKLDAEVVGLMQLPGDITVALDAKQPTLLPLAAFVKSSRSKKMSIIAIFTGPVEAFTVDWTPLFVDVDKPLPWTSFLFGVPSTSFAPDKAFLAGVHRCLECCPDLKVCYFGFGELPHDEVELLALLRASLMDGTADVVMAPTLDAAVFASPQYTNLVDAPKLKLWCHRTASGCLVVRATVMD